MRRIPNCAAAALLAAGCSHLPEWSAGPPYGDALAAEEHHDGPASAERAAEPAAIEGFDSHPACLRRLSDLAGEVVTISPAEARGYRHGPDAIEELTCAGATLLQRSWSAARH